MRIMVLVDGKRIQITDAEEAAINKALPNESDRVMVHNIWYKKTMIGYFDDPNTAEMQVIGVVDVFPGARLQQRRVNPNCKAQHSIQREINNIIRDENPRSWGKKIGDKAERKRIYDQLWAASQEWCDDKKEVCVCDPDFKPEPFNVTADMQR